MLECVGAEGQGYLGFAAGRGVLVVAREPINGAVSWAALRHEQASGPVLVFQRLGLARVWFSTSVLTREAGHHARAPAAEGHGSVRE
jgi:hypothetical protein